MARTVQLVRYIKRRFMAFASGEIVSDDLQMTRCFFREYIVKHRVHLEGRFFLDRLFTLWHCDRQNSGVRIAIRKRICSSNKQTDIGGRFRANLELLHELRYSRCCNLNEIDHRRRAKKRVIDQTIEQVFYRPAILTNPFRTDHASAALQRMKGAPHSNEFFHIVRRPGPRRQVLFDGGDFFFCFLDEELNDLRIHLRGVISDDRQWNDLSSLRRQTRQLFPQGLGRPFFYSLDGQSLCWVNCGRVLFLELSQTFLYVPQHRETGLSVIEHVPRLAATSLHRLHVVLDTDDDVSKAISFLLVQYFQSARV